MRRNVNRNVFNDRKNVSATIVGSAYVYPLDTRMRRNVNRKGFNDRKNVSATARLSYCRDVTILSWRVFRFAPMDLVHYREGIPSAMHCGYFVLVKMLLCRHYPMLKGLYFSGVSQDLAIPQTGYITRKCSEKTFTAYNQSV